MSRLVFVKFKIFLSREFLGWGFLNCYTMQALTLFPAFWWIQLPVFSLYPTNLGNIFLQTAGNHKKSILCRTPGHGHLNFWLVSKTLSWSRHHSWCSLSFSSFLLAFQSDYTTILKTVMTLSLILFNYLWKSFLLEQSLHPIWHRK
jgi:hypothetical protein